ncbi:Protein of unknown function, partial [Pyronema omphalodes CBS 100304]
MHYTTIVLALVGAATVVEANECIAQKHSRRVQGYSRASPPRLQGQRLGVLLQRGHQLGHLLQQLSQLGFNPPPP